MLEKYYLIFGGIGLLGLIIMGIGFKTPRKYRSYIETIGATIFHIGAFGILYKKIALKIFVALILFVLSLFILFDPLKISEKVNKRHYRLIGFIVFFAASTFALEFFTSFPVWLWIVPIVIYLVPILVPPLKKRQILFSISSWATVIVYLSIITYLVYVQFNPNYKIAVLDSWFPEIKISNNVYQKPETTPVKPKEKTVLSTIPSTVNEPNSFTKPIQKQSSQDTTNTKDQTVTVIPFDTDLSNKNSTSISSLNQNQKTSAKKDKLSLLISNLQKFSKEYKKLKKENEDLKDEIVALKKALEEQTKEDLKVKNEL